MKVIFGLLLSTLLPMTTAFMWIDSLGNDTETNVCFGHDIHIPWNYTLSDGERIEDIKWFFRAEDGAEALLIAVVVLGNFNPSASFSGRVNWTGDAGIVLGHPTFRESGNYSIEVSIDESSFLKKSSRAVSVRVIYPPTAESGELQVRQKLEAVYDNTTEKWRVQLTCGVFTDLGHPAVHVVWTTPDGNSTVESSSESNGTFRLLLHNPLSGGNYTCTLPPSLATSCLPRLSPLLEGATVTVDEFKAGFTLLEARQRETETRQEEMMAENARLRTQLGDYCTCTSEKRASETRRVSFHAKLATDVTSVGILKPFTVLTNEGQAFDKASGVFTAPVNGSYFFAASVGTDQNEKTVWLSLQKDDVVMSRAFVRQDSTYQTMGSVQATTSLTAGASVWLQSDTEDGFYSSRSSSFTGFLINADD